jgi:hypothetical protein
VSIGWQVQPPPRPRGRAPKRSEWRADDRAVLVGLIGSIVLLALYIGFWTNWFTLAGGPKPPGNATTVSSDGTSHVWGDQHASWGWVMTGVLVGVPIILALAFMWRERRSARRQFDARPDAERERRRQAAALLRRVEPPVDEATALEELRSPGSGRQPPPLTFPPGNRDN